MDGYIKLHRKILENPIVCKDSDYFSIWSYLLLNATHTEYQTLFKGEKITLVPGQLLTGRKSIATKFNINESKVQRVLKKLEIEQQIEQQTSNGNRLITILKWEEYQFVEQQNEQRVNNKRTTSEQRVNTNKKEKNDKKVEKKNIYGEYKHVKLTEEQYKKIFKDFGNEFAAKCIKKLDEYIEQKGEKNCKYSNYNLVIRSWVKEAVEKDEKKLQAKQKPNQFNAFPQREYTRQDYSSMEQRLLNKGG